MASSSPPSKRTLCAWLAARISQRLDCLLPQAGRHHHIDQVRLHRLFTKADAQVRAHPVPHSPCKPLVVDGWHIPLADAKLPSTPIIRQRIRHAGPILFKSSITWPGAASCVLCFAQRPEAAILTVDSVGDRAASDLQRGGAITPVTKRSHHISLGLLYSASRLARL